MNRQGILGFNRRRFVLATLAALPVAAAADAFWIEPRWLKVRRLRLAAGKPTHRLVHFTDLHHKGNRAFLESVVRKINAQSPDFVCFTGDIIGDLIEKPAYLEDALPILAKIKSPLYGVPGNHDYWSKVSFEPIGKTFAATGGGWLLDEQRHTRDGQVTITGLACKGNETVSLKPDPRTKNVLLMHYPAWVDKLGGEKYNLLLAGHSHGGQVRLPFVGALSIPFNVDEYDMGLFQTPNGPLYVNPGIGYFVWRARFLCRPEITVIEF